MTVITEVMNGVPFDRPERVVRRDEAMLFQAVPPFAMKFLTPDLQPLAVYTVPTVFKPVEFARPRGVFEGAGLRVEFMTMTGRQPFYHRNADVDEIGYQICGERTLLTECGTVEFGPGQLARIPLGAAHDNYCREDIHLIFYMHGPAVPCVEPVGRGEHRVPPFPGWQPRPMIETLTNCLGGPHCDLAYGMADETMLLDAASGCTDALELLEPSGTVGGVEWLYKAPKVWIGHTTLERGEERHYLRNVCADEIQYQEEGTRTIVSQRGVVTLEPGDLTCIPAGCGYSNVSHGRSKHLSLLTSEPAPPIMEPTRLADIDVAGWLNASHARQPEQVN